MSSSTECLQLTWPPIQWVPALRVKWLGCEAHHSIPHQCPDQEAVELYLCFPCMSSWHAQDSFTHATALPNINIAMTVKAMFKYMCIVFGSDLNPHSTSLMMTVKYNFSFQFFPTDTVSSTMFCYNDK